MKPLLLGFSDSLDILAFKWRSIRPASQKWWLVGILLFVGALLLLASLTGIGLRTVMTTPFANSDELQQTLIIWLNVFLADNASIAAGGVIWALVASIVLIPLVGYSFASIIPEGDLASIKVTDNHKISDSILLQYVSTISFVQLLVLTALTSVFTINSSAPGLGIFFSWGLWSVSVLATVLAAWFFEYLFRRFGIKSKLLVFATIAIVLGILYLMNPDTFAGMFGLGDAFVAYVQGLDFAHVNNFGLGLLALAAIALFLLLMISIVASRTLKRTERVKKKNDNIVLVARLGLQNKNRITGMTQFLGSMIFRQSNIWKPLALSTAFAASMGVVFYTFYDVLIGLATLIPIMVCLVWSINVFGIMGAGTTWLVSLPHGKQKVLGSVLKIQYIIIAAIAFFALGSTMIFHEVSFYTAVKFLLTLTAATLVLSHFSIRKAVYNPYRYRVHIRGESVIPPNKAFSYMFQLFAVGFLTAGLCYGVTDYISTITSQWVGLSGLVLIVAIIALIMKNVFNSLKYEWMSSPEIIQNIIKAVGQH